MAIQLIGAGYGRTGTMSTHTALNQLGFPCYHMFEVQKKKNAGHLDFWLEVARGKEGEQHNWDEVFADYQATIDNPASCVWRELMQAYPDAKVLLTLHPRGAETWYESTIDTIYLTQTMWQIRFIRLFFPDGRKMGEMTSKLVWQRAHKNTMPDREAAIAEYHRHIEEVKALVPPDKLLVFTADQGWEPLCEFLGVSVPDEPFPNVNDRDQIKKMFNRMSRVAYAILAGCALVVGALGYGIYAALG